MEIGLFPALGHDLDHAGLHRFDRRLGERLGIDIPLVGEPGFDDHAAAVAIGCLDGAWFGVVSGDLAVLAGDDMRHQTAQRLHPLDDQLACVEAVYADELGGDQAVGGLHHAGLGIEHVEHVRRRDACAPSDLEIVEIMPRRDLHCARTQLGIGMVVGDNRDAPPGDRQLDIFADDAGIARVLAVHRDRHIGEHRLGPRRRDDDMVAPVIQSHAIRQRIAEVPEMALDLARLDLEIADRGLELGVPVDEALVAIDQPLVVQVDEHLEHRLAEMRVHGELLARPVHRTAQTAELTGDRAAAFLLPLPDFLDEVLTAVVGALVLLGLELAFDHHLRRDARMVGADHPQGILAAQPLIADHDVLQRVVERMADMQTSRHVRRRVDDGVRLGTGPLGPECVRPLPMRIPFRLDRGGVEGLGQFGLVGHGLAISEKLPR